MNKKISEKKKEYREVLKKRQTILDRLAELKETDIFKEYKKLIDENDKLYNDENKLYKELKVNEYENCDHVLVETYTDCESGYEGRTYHYYGCIKCGCNEYVKEKRHYLTEEEKIMLDYIESQTFSQLEGKRLGVYCENLPSATKKYNSLKRNNKDLDEKVIIEMFKTYVNGSNNKTRIRKPESSYTVNIWDVP